MENWLRPGESDWLGSCHCSLHCGTWDSRSIVLTFCFCTSTMQMTTAPQRIKANNEHSTVAGTEGSKMIYGYY